MADMMTFPDTWEEFEELYHITDTEQIYTNGARLIPSFRVEQWLEHMADRNCSEKPNNCEACKYEDLESYEGACDDCTDMDGRPTNYEPKTEPLDKDTNVRSKEPQIIACPIQEEDAEYARWLYEPQTDCAWGKGEE